MTQELCELLVSLHGELVRMRARESHKVGSVGRDVPFTGACRRERQADRHEGLRNAQEQCAGPAVPTSGSVIFGHGAIPAVELSAAHGSKNYTAAGKSNTSRQISAVPRHGGSFS